MVQEGITTCWQTRLFERMLLLQTAQGPNKYWKKSFICFCWQNRWTKSLKSSWTQYLNKVFEDNTKYLKNILEKANLLATSLKQVCERHLWAESLNEIIGTIFEPNPWNKKSLNQVFEKMIEAIFEQNVWTHYLNKSLPPTGGRRGRENADQDEARFWNIQVEEGVLSEKNVPAGWMQLLQKKAKEWFGCLRVSRRHSAEVKTESLKHISEKRSCNIIFKYFFCNVY